MVAPLLLVGELPIKAKCHIIGLDTVEVDNERAISKNPIHIISATGNYKDAPWIHSKKAFKPLIL